MALLVENFETFVIVGVIAVIAIAQVHRTVGAAIGAVFYVMMAIIGTGVYQQGGAIGMLGRKFSQPVFYGFVAFMFFVTVVPAIAKRNRKRPTHVED